MRFQPSLGGTLSLGRTNSFFLGGGRAMLNALYLTAERLGVEVLYDAEVVDLDIAGRHVPVGRRSHGGRAPHGARRARLVAAAGGFEANIEWLKQYWGEAADNFLIRGTPYNRGTVLQDAARQGRRSRSAIPTQCHAVAIDARAPKFDGGIITRLDCVVFGIVVNKRRRALLRRGRGHLAEALRDLGPARRRAAGPDRLHHLRRQSLDAVHALALPAGRRRPAIRELAGKLELDPDALEATVDAFNAAVRPGTFDHTILDDCRTEGLTPPKSHWARRIETRPSTPIRCGRASPSPISARA